MGQRKSFLLRIDPKLYDALASWAAQDLRSLNAQIEFLLRRELEKNGRLPKFSDALTKPDGPADADEDAES